MSRVFNRYGPAAWFTAAAAVILLCCYAAVWATPAAGLVHDDGIYIATAKAIANGDGYVMPNLPGSPPQTKFPPLFPFLLSLLWRLNPKFPDNVRLLKIIPVASVFLTSALTGLIARRMSFSRWNAWLIALFFAAIPSSLYFSGLVMSETLYAALASLAILLLLRAEADGSWRSVVLAAVATIAAYYTRTAAIALVLGGALALASRRRWAQCGIFLALCYGLALLPWQLWQGQQAPAPLTESYYTSLSYRQFNIVSGFTIPQKISILRQNIRFLGDDITYLLFTPPRYISWAYIPFCAAIAAGFYRLRRYRAFVMPAIVSIAMPVLWAWRPQRFIIPSMGFLVIALVAAAPTLRPSWVLAVLAVPVSITLAFQTADSVRKGIPAITLNRYPDNWKQVFEIDRWLSANSRPDAVVISALDPLVYLGSGRKSIRAFYVDPLPIFYGIPSSIDAGAEFSRVMRTYKPEYIVKLQPDFFADRFVGKSIQEALCAGLIEPAFASGHFQIYRVVRSRWEREGGYKSLSSGEINKMGSTCSGALR